MARTDETWEEVRGSFLKTLWVAGRDILINGYNHYLNFGFDSGDTGYGFRDNAGTMQFKNYAGVWVDIGGAGATGITELPITAGTIDGENTIFTFTEKPIYILSDGIKLKENAGWTWLGLTATLSLPPQYSLWGEK